MTRWPTPDVQQKAMRDALAPPFAQARSWRERSADTPMLFLPSKSHDLQGGDGGACSKWRGRSVWGRRVWVRAWPGRCQPGPQERGPPGRAWYVPHHGLALAPGPRQGRLLPPPRRAGGVPRSAVEERVDGRAHRPGCASPLSVNSGWQRRGDAHLWHRCSRCYKRREIERTSLTRPGAKMLMPLTAVGSRGDVSCDMGKQHHR